MFFPPKTFSASRFCPCCRVLPSDVQVKLLESNGNWATDWSVVRISGGVAGRFSVDRVRGNCFHGPVLLGDFAGEVMLLLLLALMVMWIMTKCAPPADEQNK